MAVDEASMPATGYEAYGADRVHKEQPPRHDTWSQVQRPAGTNDVQGQEEDGQSSTSTATTTTTTAAAAAARRLLNCYGNNAFYIFFRLYQTLYARLHELKQQASNEHFRRKLNPVAVDLSMQHRPSSLNEYNIDAENYYEIELDLIARLLTQDIDKTTFEDNTRYLFGTKGY
ncbi:hypothetical protein SYNPS1DRAFT_25624, partial [Syncephalis pseudoplumigaleata]